MTILLVVWIIFGHAVEYQPEYQVGYQPSGVPVRG